MERLVKEVSKHKNSDFILSLSMGSVQMMCKSFNL
jgi:hypothetical protein